MKDYPQIEDFAPCHEEVVLHRKRHMAQMQQASIQRQLIRDIAHLEIQKEEIYDRLLYTLWADIFGIDHPEKHVAKYPSNWLEALKERFAPRWALARWPVKYTEIVASLNETYPELTQRIPHGNAVWKMVIRTKPWTSATS